MSENSSPVMPQNGRILASRLSAPRNNFNGVEDAALRLESHYRDVVSLRCREIANVKIIRERCLRVMNWVMEAERRQKPGVRGYMFAGGCGNGKSTMCEAIRRFYQMLPVPLSITMITANELNRMASEKTADDGRFERMCITPRLIIDDLGTQQPSVLDYGNQRFPFNEVLEERYNRNLITVISTNITKLDEFNRLYGPRVVDRMREFFLMEPVNENSYR